MITIHLQDIDREWDSARAHIINHPKIDLLPTIRMAWLLRLYIFCIPPGIKPDRTCDLSSAVRYRLKCRVRSWNSVGTSTVSCSLSNNATARPGGAYGSTEKVGTVPPGELGAIYEGHERDPSPPHAFAN